MSSATLPTAKLFMHGRSQAIRLPKEFRFAGSEVYLRRLGEDVVISAKPTPSVKSLIESLSEFEPGFEIQRDQPRTVDVRPELFKKSGR